jgi:hypothetical protein
MISSWFLFLVRPSCRLTKKGRDQESHPIRDKLQADYLGTCSPALVFVMLVNGAL